MRRADVAVSQTARPRRVAQGGTQLFNQNRVMRSTFDFVCPAPAGPPGEVLSYLRISRQRSLTLRVGG